MGKLLWHYFVTPLMSLQMLQPLFCNSLPTGSSNASLVQATDQTIYFMSLLLCCDLELLTLTGQRSASRVKYGVFSHITKRIPIFSLIYEHFQLCCEAVVHFKSLLQSWIGLVIVARFGGTAVAILVMRAWPTMAGARKR